MGYQVGQTATAKDGRKVRWTGDSWEAVPGTGGGTGGGGKMSPQAQAFLNKLSEGAAAADGVRRTYDAARDSIKAVKPGPYRGRMMEIATPEEGGGFFDTLGSLVVGAPMRMIGAITPEETSAYQKLRALQSSNVLDKQILQKGPQTESDAARLQLTEISPSKMPDANESIIKTGIHRTNRDKARPVFYTKFANHYGLNGVNPQGKTADQLWAIMGDQFTKQLFPQDYQQQQKKSGIRVISVRDK